MPHFFTLHLVLISSSSFFSLALHPLALLLHFPPSLPFSPSSSPSIPLPTVLFPLSLPLFTPSPPSLRSDANTFHAMLLPFRLDLFSLPLSLSHTHFSSTPPFLFLTSFPSSLFPSITPSSAIFFLSPLLLLPPSLSLPLLVHQSTLIRYRS